MRPSWTDQRASDYLIVTQNAAEITRSRCSGGRIAKSIAKIDPPTDALLRALRAAEDAAGLRRPHSVASVPHWPGRTPKPTTSTVTNSPTRVAVSSGCGQGMTLPGRPRGFRPARLSS